MGLARAHARTGDAAQIAGYLGKYDTFAQAISKFAVDYADQTERDHAVFVKAIRTRRLQPGPPMELDSNPQILAVIQKHH